MARCYCGAVRLSLPVRPRAVSYCHCSDCRRWTGTPVAAFAAFDRTALAEDALPAPTRHSAGVARWNCTACGSPLAATFDYLPEQIYVALGLFEDLDTLPPHMHSHHNNAPDWLNIRDDLPRHGASARESLNGCT